MNRSRKRLALTLVKGKFHSPLSTVVSRKEKVRTMKRKLMISAMVIMLSAPSVLLAQRGGRGGGGQGSGGQQGQGAPPTTEQRGGGQQGQQGSRTGQQTGSRDQQKKGIHTTDKQRDQYKTCLRKQSAEMSQRTQGSNFDLSQAREQRDRVREETRILMEEHDRFMKGLSGEQRSVMGDEIQKMDKSREELKARLQAMDRELDQAKTDRNRINERARELNEAVREFQKQHRAIGSQMDVEPPLN
jgi:hypothetical protein